MYRVCPELLKLFIIIGLALVEFSSPGWGQWSERVVWSVWSTKFFDFGFWHFAAHSGPVVVPSPGGREGKMESIKYTKLTRKQRKWKIRSFTVYLLLFSS